MRARVWIAVITLSCAPDRQSGSPERPPDASTGGSRDAHGTTDGTTPAIDAPATSADAAPFACKQPNILHGDGHHNPGQDCMGLCHIHGFSLAGTLMMADGTTPANNATVTVVDANHFSQDLVVGNNGNFFSYLPVTYPVTVYASMCPDVKMMVSQATAGGCNSSSCHGGAQGIAHL